MIWLILLAAIIALLAWFLFSPLIMEVDTRIPRAGMRWVSIGRVQVWYEGEWWLSMQIFFYHKTMRFSEIKSTPKKKKKEKVKRKPKVGKMLKKMVNVIRTFRVTQWRLAVDTDDYPRNAQLYPLNFLPNTLGHLDINFRDENYLVLTIKNRPWKILYAFLK